MRKAIWLFPRLALRALRVEAVARRAIWRDGAAVALALLCGAGVALAIQPMATPAWWPGLAGLGAYAAALVFISGALQRELQALAGARATP